MDVEPERPVEQAGRDQQPVGGDDERVGGERGLGRQPLLLADRDPEPLRALLRRRRAGLPAAAARAVRAREQLHDLVPAGEALEHVGPERRRRGDGDPRHAA